MSLSSDGWLGCLVLVAVLAATACERVQDPSLANSRPSDGTDSPVVAEVGEVQYTANDVLERLSWREEYIRLRFSSPERKRVFLEKLVETELLAQEAVRSGMTHDPVVMRQLRRALADKLTKQIRLEAVREDTISEAEVKTYYETHREELHQSAGGAEARLSTKLTTEIRNRIDRDRATQAVSDLKRRLRSGAKILIDTKQVDLVTQRLEEEHKERLLQKSPDAGARDG